ncbi:MAG: hypothetical protein MOB07_23250 [Acidobacteria bacterium]|nr:hypothetical protein [Acidobacteriota bacterium]
MKFTVQLNMAAFKKALEPGVARTLKDFTFAFRAKIAELYGGVKTGRFYRRPSPLTGTYRASAPGEPPAIASGRMFRALSERFPSPFKAEIKIDTPYAAILEGLDPSDRVAPRPFVRPALKSVSERFGSVRDRF